MSEPLFCHCLQIADREFLIEVAQDGIIHWDDYQTRRRLRGVEDRYLKMKTILGDASARRRFNAEIDEFTVSFPRGRMCWLEFALRRDCSRKIGGRLTMKRRSTLCCLPFSGRR